MSETISSDLATLLAPIERAIDRGLALEDAIPGAPVFPPPDDIAEDDASALVRHVSEITAHADQIEAAATAYVENQRKRVSRILDWWGKALLWFAQAKIGKKSPRRLVLPLGTLALRKEPDRLVAIEDAVNEKAFRIFDARADHAWSRVQAKFESLTHAELDQLMNALPETLMAKLHYEIEPKKAELTAHWKQTGEIPAGFVIVPGEDRLKLDTTLVKGSEA